MEDNIKIVYKKCGQTPLDCIKELRENNKNLVNLPLTYAGRLDPLAEGLLIVLIGDECNKKDDYLKLSKEYEVDALFGFATDTYDLMGIVIAVQPLRAVQPLAGFGGCTAISETLPNFIGKIKQSYPPYSSRTVNGKPLFMWAREDRLKEIEIPSHDVFVEDIKIIKEDSLNGENLLKKIKNDISLVNGDFRQKEIIDKWEDVLKDKKENDFKIIKLKISCGGGVYVRGIVNDIGKKIGVPALALNILRTKIGEYKIIKNN